MEFFQGVFNVIYSSPYFVVCSALTPSFFLTFPVPLFPFHLYHCVPSNHPWENPSWSLTSFLTFTEEEEEFISYYLEKFLATMVSEEHTELSWVYLSTGFLANPFHQVKQLLQRVPFPLYISPWLHGFQIIQPLLTGF